jgi:hypothetical protein
VFALLALMTSFKRRFPRAVPAGNFVYFVLVAAKDTNEGMGIAFGSYPKEITNSKKELWTNQNARLQRKIGVGVLKEPFVLPPCALISFFHVPSDRFGGDLNEISVFAFDQ